MTMDTSIEKAGDVILRYETVSCSRNVDQGYTIMIWKALI